MIGQKELLGIVKNQIENSLLRRFCILVGPDGSGKKTLANEMARDLCYYPTLVTDLSKSNIVKIINQSYTTLDTQVYIIADTDDMSLRSKNSLLKVFEEPPNNAYFILTCKNIDNVLPTIRSRGSIYYMRPYSRKELTQYLSTYISIRSSEEAEIILSICDTPGEINQIRDIAVLLYEYVLKVVDNIAEVSGANAFKIANKIALKKDRDGYDLCLFWKVFKKVCVDRIEEDPIRYCTGIQITSKYESELGIKGINRESLFDAWLLDIRKEWME